ncbi:hypothetical protein F5050DRAFT_1795704 [Lentinula boryana]|uniref:Uncharacterized protein n=1 Tax=Lentinula boryana TaxID=40481 RepID=A0ABQ8PWM3_9AGAR|nr:hypothetical protein F5050DRAFT_1795704 [Lentinula boryana]
MRCLNLPLHLQEDSNNVYIPGFFQGPKEPRAVTAQLAPLLSPLMSDMEIAYHRGIRCRGCYDHAKFNLRGPDNHLPVFDPIIFFRRGAYLRDPFTLRSYILHILTDSLYILLYHSLYTYPFYSPHVRPYYSRITIA